MKGTNLKKTENDNKIKKRYLPKFFWLKNGAIYPPSIFLFFSLFGLVYLLNYDLLLTFYAIPFVVLFFLATIWLKTTKKYTLNKLLADEDAYLVCLSAAVKEEGKVVTSVFTTGSTRHNKYFVRDLAKQIQDSHLLDTDLFTDIKGKEKNKPVLVVDENNLLPPNVYIVHLNKTEIVKARAGWSFDEVFPLFYLDQNQVALINLKDLNKM